MKFDSNGDSIKNFIAQGDNIMFDCHTYKRFGKYDSYNVVHIFTSNVNDLSLPAPEYSKEICGFFVVKAWLKTNKVKGKDEEEIFKSDSSDEDTDPSPRHNMDDYKTENEEKVDSFKKSLL